MTELKYGQELVSEHHLRRTAQAKAKLLNWRYGNWHHRAIKRRGKGGRDYAVVREAKTNA